MQIEYKIIWNRSHEIKELRIAYAKKFSLRTSFEVPSIALLAKSAW